MAKKLWDKGEQVNSRMQALTVADDPVVDRNLICFDALGSAAHAKMLAKQGILSKEDSQRLISALERIYKLGLEDNFEIPFELEDVHTAIESHLVADLGDLGKRIHAARSRNDQAALAMRLFCRNSVVKVLSSLVSALNLLEHKFEKEKDYPMPGYTHMQAAMPSSVGLWLHSFYEALLLAVKEGLDLYDNINSCPLGSSAGFGTNLKIDRQAVAETLSFARVQRSVIDVNNSRGLYEEKVLSWCTSFLTVLEKWAFDGVLFCSKEFSFCYLDNELTTGSSVMPQKRNPDLLEVLRARPSRVKAAQTEISAVISKLPSSYHRDLQFTKAPLVRGIAETLDCLEMFSLSIEGLHFNKHRLEEAMYLELYATYYANNLVSKGMPFRDAYAQTAQKVKSGDSEEFKNLENEFEIIQSQTVSSMQAAALERQALAVKVLALESIEQNLANQVF
jgi:argininosuccinate lyase